jgi:beta-glucosidase
MKLNLPNDFIWGTATAAHQVEGDNKNSDFWFLENFKNTTFAEPSGIACDQWNRYEEDIKMMVGPLDSIISNVIRVGKNRT